MQWEREAVAQELSRADLCFGVISKEHIHTDPLGGKVSFTPEGIIYHPPDRAQCLTAFRALAATLQREATFHGSCQGCGAHDHLDKAQLARAQLVQKYEVQVEKVGAASQSALPRGWGRWLLNKFQDACNALKDAAVQHGACSDCQNHDVCPHLEKARERIIYIVRAYECLLELTNPTRHSSREWTR